MSQKIEKIKNLRVFLLKQLDGLTPEELNKIPNGYNNNIIWNIGHLISANQSLCYMRSGQPPRVDQKYILPFFTNTKPMEFVNGDEIRTMKQIFINSIDVLAKDFENNIFTSYTPSENIERLYGMKLKNIEDALDFLLYHEGFHSGYITSMIRVVTA